MNSLGSQAKGFMISSTFTDVNTKEQTGEKGKVLGWGEAQWP